MLKILILSVLLTTVYSWDEIKYTLMTVFRLLLRRQTKVRIYRGQTDKMVGSLIMIATVPFALAFFVASTGDLVPKFFWLTIFLLLSSAIATGSSVMMGRLRFANNFSGSEKTFATLYSLLGFISPIFEMFRGSSRQDKKTLGKFALFLSIPPIVGIFMKFSTNSNPENLIPHTETLITVLTLSLFLRIGVDFLEKMFKTHKLKTLFSYYRVLLGIILTMILLMG